MFRAAVLNGTQSQPCFSFPDLNKFVYHFSCQGLSVSPVIGTVATCSLLGDIEDI